MSPSVVLARLRRFLLVFSALMLCGALVELWLAKHTENFTQLIPFALCGLALASLLVALVRPRQGPVWALRGAALLLLAGSFYGVYEHYTNSVEFQREIDPTASAADALVAALGGPNPLLAPGILAAAAALALAATYRHPALGDEGAEDG
jgi:hypothetical protein